MTFRSVSTTALHLLSAVVLLAEVCHAQRASVTLEHILSVNYSQLNLNVPSLTQVLPGMCASTKTEYKMKLRSDEHPDVYRVPHSRIFEEGSRCGDKDDGYPEARLWIERHMLLAPYELLKSNITAERAGIVSFYSAFRGDWRKIMQSIVDQIETEVADADMWIGWEQLDRVCGGRTILNAGTFVLFARTKQEVGVNVQVTMIDPTTNDKYNMSRTKFEYYNGDDIHISFFEVLAQEVDTHDVICPSQNSAFDTAAVLGGRSEKHSASCFPGDATVELESGETKRMVSLSIGDRVHVGSGMFSPVFMFTHRLESESSQFTVLETDSGRSLSLSRGHYVYANNVLVPAKEIFIGDYLRLGSGAVTRVVNVAVTRGKGLFNPQTELGDIVVNGIVSSTFTTALDPGLAHILLSPLRLLSRYGYSTRLFESGASGIVDLYRKGMQFCNMV
jgi:Hint module